MRWGIQTESADNHSEVQTCLNEIDLCKKYSLATNFVVSSISSSIDLDQHEFDYSKVLLSHRYGSRPTPAIIRAPLFEQLQQIVRSNEDDAELLAQWYRLDTNQLPAAYVLRSISSMFPQILSVVRLNVESEVSRPLVSMSSEYHRNETSQPRMAKREQPYP